MYVHMVIYINLHSSVSSTHHHPWQLNFIKIFTTIQPLPSVLSLKIIFDATCIMSIKRRWFSLSFYSRDFPPQSLRLTHSISRAKFIDEKSYRLGDEGKCCNMAERQLLSTKPNCASWLWRQVVMATGPQAAQMYDATRSRKTLKLLFQCLIFCCSEQYIMNGSQ